MKLSDQRVDVHRVVFAFCVAAIVLSLVFSLSFQAEGNITYRVGV